MSQERNEENCTMTKFIISFHIVLFECLCQISDGTHEDVSKTFRTESINEINNNKHSVRSNIQRVMAAKLTKVTHKIAIQLHLVAESCTICSSRSRQPAGNFLIHPRTCSSHGVIRNVYKILIGKS
jgi:hypothetical protein